MDIWTHGVFYFKYNQFKKFPIELWEDACSWLSGKKKSYLLEWTTGYLLSFSNVNHSLHHIKMLSSLRLIIFPSRSFLILKCFFRLDAFEWILISPKDTVKVHFTSQAHTSQFLTIALNSFRIVKFFEFEI